MRVRAVVPAGLLLAGALAAQQQAPPRPRPYPVFESQGFQRAVARGTRTRTGVPGAAYWQQRAEYRLSATLDPATKRLTGEGTVRYTNHSPDTLRVIYFHLYQNLFAPDAVRNRWTPVTKGMELARVSAQGSELHPSDDEQAPGYTVDATRLRIRLAEPLLPGATAEFAFAWAYIVPPDEAPRGGTDGEVFFVSYWYPQVAVYDDVNGWQIDPYLGNAEFYMGYGDYDVALTVPAGWLVAATGELTNPEKVLAPAVRERLRRATTSVEVIHVVADADGGAAAATVAAQGGVTWRFHATNVRDFAFGSSDRYLWDAAAVTVGDRDGDGKPDRALISTFYRPSRRAWAWDQSARYAQHAIGFLSRYLWPYPYPQATAVDGVTSCAGMEYPMVTCIGGPRDTLSLSSVTVHELGHMWFPMQVGSDEKRYAWQDEGLTRFNQAQGMRDFFRGYDREPGIRQNYLDLARTGGEVELMRHGDLYPYDGRAYSIASYDKMATNLMTLRGLVGDRHFHDAYRAYGRAWVGKHPTPWDFFNSFNQSLGKDYGWFWRTWWYETWVLDQAIGEVKLASDSTSITIEDRGLAPMPARIVVRRSDGSSSRYEIPVDTWLAGERRWTFRVRTAPMITSIEIDPEGLFPDIDRSNNVWRRLPPSQ